MTFTDTISIALSSNYKERFMAEYWQTRIRAQSLADTLQALDENTCSFEPTYPISLLSEQYEAMDKYLTILEKRAKIEGIDLTQLPKQLIKRED